MQFNKILSTVLGTALLFGAWACTEEVSPTPSPTFNGDDVYFSNELATDIDVPMHATSISVPVNRVKSETELVAGISGYVSADAEGAEKVEGIFTIPTSVTFAEGQTAAELPITIDFDKMEAEKKYYLHLQLAEGLSSPYGTSKAEYTLSYQPWGPFQRLGGNDDYGTFTLSAFGIDEDYCAVYVSYSTVEGDNRVKYQFGDYDCPEINPDENTWSWFVNGYNATLICNPDDNTVIWEPMPTGDDSSFGSMIYVADVYTYRKQFNPDIFPGNTEEELRTASFYNPETGRIGIVTVYFTLDEYILNAAEYFQLPGYASYGLDFTYLGHFIEEPGLQETAQIQIHKTDDLGSYAFRFVEGEITSDEANEILDEMRAEEGLEQHSESTAVYSYYLRTAGTYTFVALGFDAKGNEVLTKTWSFNFTPAIPYNWKTVGYSEYTDGFITGAYNIPDYTWDVEVEQSTEDPNIIRIVNPYKSGNGWGLADARYDVKGNYYITLNIADPDFVYIYEGALGIQLSSADGPIIANSRAKLYLDQGRPVNQVKRQGHGGTITDGVIEFPGSSLIISFNGEDWYDTNFDPNIDPKDFNAQMASKGTFYLDLNTLDLSGTQSKKPAVRKYIAGEKKTDLKRFKVTKRNKVRK